MRKIKCHATKRERFLLLATSSLNGMVNIREEFWKKFINLLQAYQQNNINWYDKTTQVTVLSLCQSINIINLDPLKHLLDLFDKTGKHAFLIGIEETIGNTLSLKVSWDKDSQIGSMEEIYTILKEEKISPKKVLKLFTGLDRLILFYGEVIRREQYDLVNDKINSFVEKKEVP